MLKMRFESLIHASLHFFFLSLYFSILSHVFCAPPLLFAMKAEEKKKANVENKEKNLKKRIFHEYFIFSA